LIQMLDTETGIAVGTPEYMATHNLTLITT